MIPATGVRIGWAELPQRVRDDVERQLGSPVAEARTQSGGFSPGTADRVVTADGVRAFVKAVGATINEHSYALARDEIRITEGLPADAPVPRFLGSYDDGEWAALILEDVDGRHPRTPWVEGEIDAAVRALRRLARKPEMDLPRIAEHLTGGFAGWAQLAADPPADLDPWAAGHLDELRAAADRGLIALAAGDTLAHCDIRADNLLIRPDGDIVVVDWPWAATGPAWLDTLLLAVNVIVHGGDGDRVLAGVDPGQAADVIAGYTGFFLHVSRLPPPPGLPTVRAFQRAQADALIGWLMGAVAHRHGRLDPAH